MKASRGKALKNVKIFREIQGITTENYDLYLDKDHGAILGLAIPNNVLSTSPSLMQYLLWIFTKCPTCHKIKTIAGAQAMYWGQSSGTQWLKGSLHSRTLPIENKELFSNKDFQP